MLNLKNLRNNLESIKKKLKERNVEFDVNNFNRIDALNRDLIVKKEKLEQEKKILSKSKDKINFVKSKKISEEISILTKKQNLSQRDLNNILFSLPNIALDDVPVGKDDSLNKLIKKVGNIKDHNFKVKSHVELGAKNNDIDFETSIKLSGSRFVVLKDKFAKLERALINFMLDVHVDEFKYTEISPPLIVNEDVMFGTGQLPKFEDDQFEIKFDNSEQRKFLIPTAEVVLTNLVRKTIIEKNQLPMRYVASTPCFRKEAGSYGKDTKGMIRQHQFYKVELVSVVEHNNCSDELVRMLNCAESILIKLDIPYQVILTNIVKNKIVDKKDLPMRMVASTPCFRKEAGSYGKDTKGMIRQHQFYKVEMVSIVENEKCLIELDRMTDCATKILDLLELPYRKIVLCTGDMGFSAEKTFDIEVWLPSEDKYREISSCSSCGSFQARRMKARYKNDEKETVLVGTLNGSGLAVGRTLVAILENYQQEDGSIIIPKVLKPYMNNMEKICKI